MPFLLLRNDITKVQADAIVNPANTGLREGSGTSRAIYLAAGEERLTAACRKIGSCGPGKAVATEAFDLDAKYIIHAVCPAWIDGSHQEEEYLYSAYRESLLLADSLGLESIAFPLLSSGNYGYPREQAMKIAIRAVSDFLMEHEMTVSLVLYDRDSVSVSKKIFAAVEEYIDDHYVEQKDERVPGEERNRRDSDFPETSGMVLSEPGEERKQRNSDFPEASGTALSVPGEERNRRDSDFPETSGTALSEPGDERGRRDPGSPGVFVAAAVSSPTEEMMRQRFLKAPVPGKAPARGGRKKERREIRRKESFDGSRPFSEKKQTLPEDAQPEEAPITRSLDDLMRQKTETFSQMLMRLIDEHKLKDSVVYKKANVDRRLFSKIRSDDNYAPSKKTVLAFAVALELSLDETRDLLMRAGFAFSQCSHFDLIVCFFIENRMYDIYEINETLFAYGEPILA